MEERGRQYLEELKDNSKRKRINTSDYLRIMKTSRRRATLDKEALQKYQSQNVLTNLIPVLDNFSRAIAVEAKTDEARTMMEGMEMIYRSFVEALKIRRSG